MPPWTLFKLVMLCAFTIHFGLCFHLPDSKEKDEAQPEIASSSSLQLFILDDDDPNISPEVERVKRAQAYYRYLSQRKMRQAGERELREKLAQKVIPTTPASILSRLPIPRLPPMPRVNMTAIMARIPPPVLQGANAAVTKVMSNIPPQVMQTVAAVRQAAPAYIEQVRVPVMAVMTNAMQIAQRMLTSFNQGFSEGKAGLTGRIAEKVPNPRETAANLMQMVGGLMTMPEPQPKPAGAKNTEAKPPSQPNIVMIGQRMVQMVMQNLQNSTALRKAAGAMQATGVNNESLMAIGQRMLQMLSSNPKIAGLMQQVQALMAPPPSPPKKS